MKLGLESDVQAIIALAPVLKSSVPFSGTIKVYSLPVYLTNNGSFTIPVVARIKSLLMSIEHSRNNQNKQNEKLEQYFI